MTLPTTTQLNGGCEDDSDIFGPPRSSPPIGYHHHHRSRIPMISPKMRQREERKRILQLCAHKLEHIKDSEANLRRSVCINNTYCRLTDELRREKQSRYLANLPKSDTKPETARDNIFNPYNSCSLDNSNHQPAQHKTTTIMSSSSSSAVENTNNLRSICSIENQEPSNVDNLNGSSHSNNNNSSSKLHHHHHHHNHSHNNNNNHNFHLLSNNNHHNNNNSSSNALCCQQQHQQSANNHNSNSTTSSSSSLSTNSPATTASAATTQQATTTTTPARKRQISSNNLDTDLEILDRELNAINAPMPLIDPEITQGAEQLERAISSRKRLRSEDESDRLVREALSQFYIPPPQRLISAIEDCPLDVVSIGGGASGLVGMGMGMGMNLGMGMGMNLGMGMSMGMSMSMGMGMSSMSVGVSPMMSPNKRTKLNNGSCGGGGGGGVLGSGLGSSIGTNELELEFDMSQNQKEFEVIMDALRLGTPSPTSSLSSSDSCGQAAMMSESASVFHNLVVTSLET